MQSLYTRRLSQPGEHQLDGIWCDCLTVTRQEQAVAVAIRMIRSYTGNVVPERHSDKFADGDYSFLVTFADDLNESALCIYLPQSD